MKIHSKRVEKIVYLFFAGESVLTQIVDVMCCKAPGPPAAPTVGVAIEDQVDIRINLKWTAPTDTGELKNNYTRNEWRRCETTLETSGEDVKIHSERVYFFRWAANYGLQYLY